MTGKAALVIGGGGGVGRGCAVGLAGAGVDVAVASLGVEGREMVGVHSAANEIWSLGRRNLAIELDAGDAGAVADAVVRVREEFGRLDVAVVAGEAGEGVTTELREEVAAVLREAGVERVFVLDEDVEGGVAEVVAEVVAAMG